jgi:cytochrome c-type biogenesis protein CcmH
MLFWAAAACLTVLCVAATLHPLLKKPGVQEIAPNHDLQVYKDQLAELKRDAESGLIAADDADSARVEISRRLLASADEHSAAPASSARLRGIAALALAVLAPVLSWGGYALLGSPVLPDQPVAARSAKPPSPIQDLIAQAEAHLAKNPDDGRGWEVLAPIYARLGRYGEAAGAFRRSIELNGETASRLSGLGEALTGQANGVVNADAKAAFESALKLEPDEPKARLFLAVAMAREGKADAARKSLENLLAHAPASAEWAPAVKKVLASLVPQTADNKAAPGPSQDQVEAASQMSDGDRMAMIEGMVAGLAEKLRQNPADLQSWQRLIRSYIVLQKKDAAAKAFADAQAVFKDDAEKLASIRTFAKELGLNGG